MVTNFYYKNFFVIYYVEIHFNLYVTYPIYKFIIVSIFSVIIYTFIKQYCRQNVFPARKHVKTFRNISGFIKLQCFIGALITQYSLNRSNASEQENFMFFTIIWIVMTVVNFNYFRLLKFENAVYIKLINDIKKIKNFRLTTFLRLLY